MFHVFFLYTPTLFLDHQNSAQTQERGSRSGSRNEIWIPQTSQRGPFRPKRGPNERGGHPEFREAKGAQGWPATLYSLRITGKLVPESLSNFSPFIVDIDSIINVYVQYAGSSVIHNVESWCARHDLFHLFNTLRARHNFTLSHLE